VATTRLHRHLNREETTYREGQPVHFLITGKTPLGYNAIVENAHRGLLYHDGLSAPLQTGQKLNGFIRAVRPGGKLDLSLDAAGYQRVAPLTEQIVKALELNAGHLDFDDDSSPEAIREAFGCSKKAFKQALGALYKSRRIQFKKPGIELLDNTNYTPGQ
jgi:predicted RNA-binding protein (virulence factor B family)